MVTSRAVASLNAVFVIPVPPFGGGTSSTAHRRRASTPWVSRGLQRSKEVQQILFLGVAETPEATDYAVGFGRPILEVADAPVREDRFQQIGRASILQKEDALAEAPQQQHPEYIHIGQALQHVCRHARSPVVQQAD